MRPILIVTELATEMRPNDKDSKERVMLYPRKEWYCYYGVAAVVVLVFVLGFQSIPTTSTTAKRTITATAGTHQTLPIPDDDPFAEEADSVLSSDHQEGTLAKVRAQCIDTIRAKHNQLFLPLLQNHASVLLVDPAYHENVGDTLLTLGELAFLRDGGNFTVTECKYVQAKAHAPPCHDVLLSGTCNATVALWQAGGNWGDLYLPIQSKRMKSFVDLLHYGFTIVGMPQSMYYRNATIRTQHADMLKRNIMEGLQLTELESSKNLHLVRSKVILTWREQESYKQARKLYPFATNKLVPDIAFQLGPFEPIRTENNLVDILLFLRNDRESKLGKKGRSRNNIQQILNQLPNGLGVTFTIVDWNDRLEIFGTTNILFDESAIKLVSLGKVVICDRLHAAVLSYLSRIPIVYMDQESNKLTNVLDVAFSSADICMDNQNMVFKGSLLQDSLEKALDILAAGDLQLQLYHQV